MNTVKLLCVTIRKHTVRIYPLTVKLLYVIVRLTNRILLNAVYILWTQFSAVLPVWKKDFVTYRIFFSLSAHDECARKRKRGEKKSSLQNISFRFYRICWTNTGLHLSARNLRKRFMNNSDIEISRFFTMDFLLSRKREGERDRVYETRLIISQGHLTFGGK